MNIDVEGIMRCEFSVHSLIVLIGGIFIIYTAIKEITHMLIMQNFDHDQTDKASVKILILIDIVQTKY